MVIEKDSGLPTIAVAIPTYNRGEVLVKTLGLLFSCVGIAEILIADQTKAQSADFFNQSVIARDIKLGGCKLVKGKNTLKATIVGANPSAIKKHMFGLDYILTAK